MVRVFLSAFFYMSFVFCISGAYIFIVVGVLIMVVGFVGCCGAITEHQCMLGTVSNAHTLFHNIII